MASSHSVASRDDRLRELEDRCGYIKRRLGAVLGILQVQHDHDSDGRQHGHDINDATCEVAQLVEDTLEELRVLAEALEELAGGRRTGKARGGVMAPKVIALPGVTLKEMAAKDLTPKDGA